MSTVLVVDDKEMMRDSVGATLRRAGYDIVVATDGPSALEMVSTKRPDAIVSDLKMPGMTGIELAERIAQIDDELPIILMTAFGTIETAVDAMRRGAFDYLTKPFEGDELVITVKRALRHAKLSRENAVLKASSGASGVASRRGLDRVIGESAAMAKVKEQLKAIAGSHGTVLITGESGTGKEVIARAVHELSPRAGAPFLGVNCAALSESLLESELFGHEKGAFTGADRLRRGRFELADKGTLLLDEISEVPASIQAKLLRILQERAFERVGSSLSIGVDVRIIATSNRDLPKAAADGQFREDLFFRLNVLPVHLPPLRERRSDVPALASHFVGEIARREGRQTPTIAPDVMELLSSYHWPGNVRELQNICERAVVLAGARSGSIERTLVEPWLGAAPQARKATPLHAPRPMPESEPAPAPSAPGSMIESKLSYTPGDRTLAEIERELIVHTLRRFNGHRQKTARALGIGVRTLGLKLKKWKEQSLVSQSL
jgi:DNA-binding NtrC family response regulator